MVHLGNKLYATICNNIREVKWSGSNPFVFNKRLKTMLNNAVLCKHKRQLDHLKLSINIKGL